MDPPHKTHTTLAEEGVLAGELHGSLHLATGHSGAHLGALTRVQSHGEGLASQSRLVHIDLAMVDLRK